mmetsp:Transcript_25522/g.76129  ORF Transcript_25522/g.76129 Transcript_25522/m.76129 type:complete len:161 (-) Transcript_25522:64-546(-)
MGSACAGCTEGAENPDDSDKTVAEVKRQLDRKLYWADGVRFEKGAASIKDISRPTVADLATVLKRYPNIGVTVQSYTGNQGDASKALSLSSERAEAVKALLKEGCNNPVHAKGMGYADDKGPRVELVPCKAGEAAAQAAEAKSLKEKEGRKCTGPSCVLQ